MSRFRWVLVLGVVLATLVLAAHLFGAKTDLEIQQGDIGVAWIKVEQDLDRRAATLPRLIAVLRDPRRKEQLTSLAPHIRSLALALQNLEASSTTQERIQANIRLDKKLRLLREAAERKPELIQDADLQRLLEEILAIENRIHQDRTEYNEAVQRYNVRLALFPSNLAASIFGLRRHELYLPTELHGGPERNARTAAHLP